MNSSKLNSKLDKRIIRLFDETFKHKTAFELTSKCKSKIDKNIFLKMIQVNEINDLLNDIIQLIVYRQARTDFSFSGPDVFINEFLIIYD